MKIAMVSILLFLSMHAFADSKKETVTLSKEDAAFATRVLEKVVDGCQYLWPDSQRLRQKCIKSEMQNVTELMQEIGKEKK